MFNQHRFSLLIILLLLISLLFNFPVLVVNSASQPQTTPSPDTHPPDGDSTVVVADETFRIFLPYLANVDSISDNQIPNISALQHVDADMGLLFQYDPSYWVPTLLADNGLQTPDGVSRRTIGLANESEGAWLVVAAFRNVSQLNLDDWLARYDYSRTGVSPVYQEHTLQGFRAITIHETLQDYKGTPSNLRTIVATGTMIYSIEYASMVPNPLEFERFLEGVQFFQPSAQFSASTLSLVLAESYDVAGKTLHASETSAPDVATCCGVTDSEYNPFPCPTNNTGNCTWWVRYKRTGDNRANLYACTGNANTWDECAATNYPDLLSCSPSLGDAAVWTGAGENHVQFVERIINNSTYNISEMNWDRTCQRGFDQSRTSNIKFIRHPNGSLCPRKSQGDADCNRIINLLDFEFWRRDYFGNTTTNGGDFNCSGRADLIDFEIWRRNYFLENN